MKTTITKSFNGSLTTLTLWALDDERNGPFGRLITAKMKPANDLGEKAYREHESLYAEALAGMVDEDFDAVISPPSVRKYNAAYLAAMKTKVPRDLTGLVDRQSLSHATTNTFILTSKPDLSGIRSILVVDDTFSSGRTALKTIFALRAAGLPEDARIGIAVALWIKPGSSLISLKDCDSRKVNPHITIHTRKRVNNALVEVEAAAKRESYATYQRALWAKQKVTAKTAEAQA